MCRLPALAMFLAVVANGLAQETGAAAAAAAAEQPVASSSAWSAYRVASTPRHKNSAGSKAAVQQQQHAGGVLQLAQLELTSEASPQLGPSFKNLTVQIISETASRLHVKIHPTSEKRVEVLQSVLPRPGARSGLRPAQLLYQVLQPVVKPNRPFALTIARQHTLEPVFDTRGHRLVFKDTYMELTTAIPRGAMLYRIEKQQQQHSESAVMELQQLQLLSRSNSYTLTPWERNSSSSSNSTAVNTSSSAGGGLTVPGAAASPYPFHLQVNPNGQSHGVLLLSNNVTNVLLNQTALTYKLSDGVIDLYFFMGPTPGAVLRQYSRVVGSTILPVQAVQPQLAGSAAATPAVPAAAATGEVAIVDHTSTAAAAAATVPTASKSTNTTFSVSGVLPLGTTNTSTSLAAATSQNSSSSSSSSAATVTPAGFLAAAKTQNLNNTPNALNSTATNSTGISSNAFTATATINATTPAAAAASELSPAELFQLQLHTYVDSSAHLASGTAGVMAVPLMVTHPADARARLTTRQYMIGDALLISLATTAATSRSALNSSGSTGSSSSSNNNSALPSTTQLTSNTPTRSYFTAGNWFSGQSFTRVRISQGKMVTQMIAAGDASVHIRGGSIIPLLVNSSVALQRSSTATAQLTPAAIAAAAADGEVGAQAQPVTLVIALPLEPASKRAILGQTDAGPSPPYALEKPCAMAHWGNPGRLVSCGFLYGGSSLTPNTNGTLQVWYKAVTAEGGRSGSITNLVISKANDTQNNKLKIKVVKILGVPGTAVDQPIVSVYKGGNAVKADYDAAKEVLSISGLELDAAAVLNIDWRLRKL